MAKLPSLQFYPGDWLRDPVSGCSLAAQGLWLRLMILAHDSERYGYLCQGGSAIPREQLARRCGCSLAEFDLLLAELESASVPSRTEDGVIFSRRMSRDAEERSKSAARQRKSRDMSHSSHGHVTAASQKCHTTSSSSSSTSEKPQNPLLPSALDFPEFKDAWSRWVRHRSEIRKPIRETQQKAMIEKLAAMGLARAIETINHTIAMGWQGLREPEGLKVVNGSVKHRTELDAIDFLRKAKQLPDGCFMGIELKEKWERVGFDGLDESEQRIAIDKCKRALERVR